MTVFENIKKISDKRGMSLQDVAVKAGLSKNVIYQYKNGAKSEKGMHRRAVKPSVETLKKIGAVLHVPFVVLMSDDLNWIYLETGHPANIPEVKDMYKQLQKLRDKNNIEYDFKNKQIATAVDDKSSQYYVDKSRSNNKIINVPIVGSIAMGSPITADQNIDGYIPEYFIGDMPEGRLFALKCKGHSMEPTIPDGAIAIIREQCSVEDDEIAAVLIENEATLKRVRHVGKQVILMPDNKAYKPIILDGDKSVRILGKLIRYTVDF